MGTYNLSDDRESENCAKLVNKAPKGAFSFLCADVQ